MRDRLPPDIPASETAQRRVAAIGTAVGAGALLSAAACCVLPLVFAAIGLGAGGLAAFVPWHWPLTIAAAVAVAIGWVLYLAKRRARARQAGCASSPPPGSTVIMLWLATLFVILSALWPGYLEAPLTRLLSVT